MPHVLLLTGPPASGKNTVGTEVARRRTQGVAIDVDLVRQMVVQPRTAPWQDEHDRLAQLTVGNVSALAANFSGAGFDVVIADTATDGAVDTYRARLAEVGCDLWVVLLLPSEDELARRLLSRPDYLSQGQAELLYNQQAAFLGFDAKLDNTDLTVEAAADWLLDQWPGL